MHSSKMKILIVLVTVFVAIRAGSTAWAVPADVIKLQDWKAAGAFFRADGYVGVPVKVALKNPTYVGLSTWATSLLGGGALGFMLRVALQAGALAGSYYLGNWAAEQGLLWVNGQLAKPGEFSPPPGAPQGTGYWVADPVACGVGSTGPTSWNGRMNKIIGMAPSLADAISQMIAAGHTCTGNGPLDVHPAFPGWSSGWQYQGSGLEYIPSGPYNMQYLIAYPAPGYHVGEVKPIGELGTQQPPVPATAAEIDNAISAGLAVQSPHAQGLTTDLLKALNPFSSTFAQTGQVQSPYSVTNLQTINNYITNGVPDNVVTNIQNTDTVTNLNNITQPQQQGTLDVNVINEPTVRLKEGDVTRELNTWSSGQLSEFNNNTGAEFDPEPVPNQVGDTAFDSQRVNPYPILSGFVDSIRNTGLFNIMSTVQINTSGASSNVCLPTWRGAQKCFDLMAMQSAIQSIGSVLFACACIGGLMLIFL